ncbi:hypothetical protein D3C78_1582590 [compost metagenome]
MLGKLLILTGHDRDFEVVGDLVPRLPRALQVNWLTVDPGLDLAFDHQRRTRRWHEAKHQHQQDTAAGEPEQGLRETTEN